MHLDFSSCFLGSGHLRSSLGLGFGPSPTPSVLETQTDCTPTTVQQTAALPQRLLTYVRTATKHWMFKASNSSEAYLNPAAEPERSNQPGFSTFCGQIRLKTGPKQTRTLSARPSPTSSAFSLGVLLGLVYRA